MSWSLGEMRALSVKAAKGAGFFWGEAEEAGFAVEWLEARCAPGVEALARYLSSEWNKETCPIKTGCRILDLGGFQDILPADIAQPLLLTPFISNTLNKETLTLKTKKTHILISHMDVYTSNYDPASCNENITVTAVNTGQISQESSCKSRVDHSQKPFVEILERFAHKTYAPATEESRLAGAGAGTTDND